MTKKRVLLVEDEPLIQMSVIEYLVDAGYDVIAAQQGFEAMAILENRASDLDVLLTDLGFVSGPDGWQVAQRGRELNPLLAVIYMSGEGRNLLRTHGVEGGIMLQKPFTEGQLLSALTSLARL